MNYFNDKYSNINFECARPHFDYVFCICETGEFEHRQMLQG